MATMHVNDVMIKASMGLLQVEATGSSKVSLSVVTQLGAGGAANLKVKIEGSNDQGNWYKLASSTDTNVGDVGAQSFTADVEGFLWIRAYFTHISGSPVISASINTGN